MPNLYKQYYVRTQPDSKRVIDSNGIVEKRLQKLAEQQRREQLGAGNDGFQAGIVTTDTDVVEVPDPVKEAEEEAEKIIKDAQTKAAAILKQAEEKADSVLQQARNDGYQDGRQKQLEELSQQETRLQEQYEALQSSLNENYAEKMKNMEKNLVDVILEVFNKVFHIQFDNKKHILMHLIDDAILNIEGDKKFRIKVAEENALFLENHREEILERVGGGIEIEIVADSSMDGNGCIIETDSGVFDCSLGVQLENLIKDLKSLCS